MKERIKALRNKKGFTLVELIIVIVIIAILAAIAIPSMIAYIQRAGRSVAEANSRTVYSAAGTAMTTILSNPTLTAPATINATNLAGLRTGSDYAQEVADLLGANFPGFVTVTITGNVVTSVRWSEDNGGSASTTRWAEYNGSGFTFSSDFS